MSLIEAFVNTSLIAIMLSFVRTGTALMVMPALGDSFVPERIRLLIALGISVALSPLVAANLPQPLPQGGFFLTLIVSEALIGAFIGTIARVFMGATDTAGMIVSIHSGLSTAQLFNPLFSTQGSILGALFSLSGVFLIFSLNLHHLLIAGLMDSYRYFPIGMLPDASGMSELVTKAVSTAFLVAVKMSIPFIVVTLIMYVSIGVLSRLMPQVQVFLLALPVQIVLSLFILALIFGAMMNFWAESFAQGISLLFSSVDPRGG